jgi:hypothetical protein
MPMPVGEGEDRSKFLRRVARGDASWLHAADHGITVRFEGSNISIQAPPDLPVAVTAQDLARGLLHHLAEPGDLRVWARVIHAGSNLFELCVDSSPRGDTLLDILWRLSFGESVSNEVVKDLALAILNEPQ